MLSLLQLKGELEEQVSRVPARATLTAALRARTLSARDIFFLIIPSLFGW